MDLDGGFACSDGVGYLLAQEAGDDPRHHFSFTRCQRFEALPQHCKFRLLLASYPIPFQREMNRIQQILVVEGLGEKLHGPRLHGPYRHRDVAVRSDENDRNLNIGFGELALQVESADSRQPDIEDEATGHVRKLACEELLRGPEQFDLQTHGADKALDCAPHRGIVIDNENDGLGFAHETPAPLAGRVNSEQRTLGS